MEDTDKAAFRKWLDKNTKLSDKVVRDTVSRLCRVEKMAAIDTNRDIDEYLFKLGKKPDFSKLSQSVKSQLKRACTLYYQYKKAGK